MKLIRALGITMELLSKRRVTATELAERFEVSSRTIYRDIELINQAGIPVSSHTGTDGGFELMSGFYLTKRHFSLNDLSIIYNLLSGVEGAMGAVPAVIKDKLSGLQPALSGGEQAGKLIFDMSVSEWEKGLVPRLLQAIDEKKVVSFSYTSANRSVTERRVEPAELHWGRGAWYLHGYCLLRHDYRYFRLSRFSSLEVAEERFQAHREKMSGEREGIQGLQTHLRFGLNAQPGVLEQFPGACTFGADHIDVHTVFYEMDYAVSVALSYGIKVVVVSPPELKARVIKAAADIMKLYVNDVGSDVESDVGAASNDNASDI